jgi:hypothetical protein
MSNVVFTNEAIIDEPFQPAKVDNQVMVDIPAETNYDKYLKDHMRLSSQQQAC